MNYYKVTIDDNAPAFAELYIRSKYPIRHRVTFEKYLDCLDKNAHIVEIKILSKIQYLFFSACAMPLNNLTDWDLFNKSKIIL